MKRKESKHIAVIRLQNALKRAEEKKPLTERQNKNLTRLFQAIGVLTVMSVTSCGIHASVCQGAGCKMPADLVTGIIAETKIPADKKSNYYQLRELEVNRPGFMQNLSSMFGGAK